ncbi:MAG: inner membrane CreD family protein, partial [Pseudomonadota bacterium]
MKLKNTLALRLGIIVALVAVLLIPLGMIEGVVHERSGHRLHVERDIAETWTGRQVLIGPIVNVPYLVRYRERVWNKDTEAYEAVENTRWQSFSIMPETLVVTGDVPVEQRYRGIYSVPVFSASLR